MPECRSSSSELSPSEDFLGYASEAILFIDFV
jgi:hypothetical protein